MTKNIHILTPDMLVTGLELFSDQSLADAEYLLDSHQYQIETARIEAIPLLEISGVPSEMEGVNSSEKGNFSGEANVTSDARAYRYLVGHLPISDLKEWIQALPLGTPLSSLALTHRPQFQISETSLSVCRQFLRSEFRHASVADKSGDYLGEITRSDIFEQFVNSLGIAQELTTGKTYLLLETEQKQGVIPEIVEAARVEGIPLYGILELDREGESETLPILLKLNVSTVQPFAETLRRMGYFTICDLQQTPISDELNQKAEEFLHFLDL